MLPEQQQRILGYFIEEAKDHLNTIEQGLLNLQATIGNPEMANEVFRAAHSVKGGAAMLGIESMQRTSHRLEDYFKLLKESPINVDRALESMFLRVFDALQELLEQLQGPFGLTEDKAQSIMAGVEPVFNQLQEHLDRLVADADANDVPLEVVAPIAFMPTTSPYPVEESALKLVFSSDVSAALREMLARFKQADTEESRTALEGCCQLLERFGEQFNLPRWLNLVKHGRWAVCDRNNDYRTLAPVLIKEIKKAQDLVLAGREPEITLPQALQTLAAQGDVTEASNDWNSLFSEDALFTDSDLEGGLTSDLESGLTSDLDDLASLEPDTSFDTLEAPTPDVDDGISLDELLNDAATSPSGPDVGVAELTSLADLFETSGSDLDGDWQEEDVPIVNGATSSESLDIDVSPDFADLLNDDSSDLGGSSNDFESGNELADLFGDTDTEDRVENLDNLGGDLGVAQSYVTGKTDSTDDESLLDEMVEIEPMDSMDDLFGDIDQTVTEDSLSESSIELSENPSDSLDEFDALNSSRADTDQSADIDLAFGTEGSDSFFDSDSAASEKSVSSGGEPERSEFDDFFTLDETASDSREATASGSSNQSLWEQDRDAEVVSTPVTSDSLSSDVWAEPDPLEGLNSNEFESTELGISGFPQSAMAEPDALDLDDVWASVEEISLEEEASEVSAIIPPETSSTSLDGELDNLFDDSDEISGTEAGLDLSFDDSDEISGIEAGLDLSDVDTPVADQGLDSLFGDDDAVDASEDLFSDEIPGTEAGLGLSDMDTPVADQGLDSLFSDDDAVDASEEDLFADQDVSDLDVSDLGASDLDASLDTGLGDLLDDGAENLELSSDLPSDLGGAESDAVFEGGFEGLFDNGAEPSESSSDQLSGLDGSEPETSDDALGDLFGDDTGSDDALDDLFSDADLATAPAAVGTESDFTELDGLESLEFIASDSGSPDITDLDLDLGSAVEETSSVDEFEISQSPSGNFEFDLLDLEDDGIVTGIVTDDESFGGGFGENAADWVTGGGDLDLLSDMAQAVPPTSPDANPIEAEAQLPALELPALELDDSLIGLESSVGGPTRNDDGLDDDLFDDLDQSSDIAGLEPLDTLLSELPAEMSAATTAETVSSGDEFGSLEALLNDPIPSVSPQPATSTPSGVAPIGMPAGALDVDDEFGDLEALLQDADQTLSTTAASSNAFRPAANRLTSRRTVTEQTMRVSVNHLDNLSNLVGELVVNRNTLEQDQERLRQFLDNLLFQVQQLNDVGQRMRDLYERSLLESSLISSRQFYQSSSPSTSRDANDTRAHVTGESFDALEMDRFTGFHTLSQEMIELIVRVRESASDIAYTVESSDQVTRQFRQVTNQLQEGLNKARMVPFSQAASRLPRAVRDISVKCGKEARLVVEGRDILIDKMILELLYDPMTHLVNNAITHGVETPEERRNAGKPPEGIITVRAFYQGNQTVISVGDDGAGIDPTLVKQKALQKGLISQADVQTMTVLDVYDLLFHPGFSTRDQADDFAGRGFGMDVVRTSLADIRGNITIDSEPGQGTNFTIRLPLTLSISKALSCISKQARIAFPMDGVEDMFDVSRERIQKNDQGQDCIFWRDTLLPFQNLSDLLSFNRTLGRGRVYGGNQDENMVSIVVLRSANSFIALEVDQVMGEQEIVIKQLEGPIPKPTGIAGATVLGDGRVMPIADVLELIDIALGRVRRDPTAAVWSQADEAALLVEPSKVKSEPTVLIVDDSITVRELLSMSFSKVGYRVEQARDGQEAWEKLRSGLPCDLVFCDIEMPRMDGLELLSRLQKDGWLQQIPIAMLTSRGADRHRQMAVDLGASGYFTKPYLEEALLDAANKMLHGEKLV
ncbi:hybrid sensor histidine kinase/response regulator [Leptothoe sp. PORK10 BA2]|uniref:hybrid sensor histidine kinase/response regulator n=1 Tax=Leptothoe sp. PORK10 BA2 TaxID=3110254 RepID=UPI002B21F6FA|nr:response regulator [Leptothoe sp. PORK10 BA2]MEA5466093.1 response regulator [Leptothoe sp. PORK10 BA2]